MSGVFVCYRREDARGYAGRLVDALGRRMDRTRIFYDMDALKPATPFALAIDDAIAECDALLAVIGPQWLAAVDRNGRRRLDDPEDFVRIEIGRALALGKPVFPVLVGGSSMPSAADLPPELAGLSGKQAVELSDSRWRYDFDRLATSLGLRPESTWKRRTARVALIAAAVVVVLVTASFVFDGGAAPVMPDGVRLLDIDLQALGLEQGACIHPSNCNTAESAERAREIAIRQARVAHDPRAARIYVLADLRWVLRGHPANLLYRVYGVRALYAIGYQVESDGSVLLDTAKLQHVQVTPEAGVFAYLFAWLELPLAIRNDATTPGDIENRLTRSEIIRTLGRADH
jgi:hypothetical protein